MTNFEKYFDKCMNVLAESLAFNTRKQEPTTCTHCKCDECLFQGTCMNSDLFTEVRKWLDAEYKEPQVDWSKVAVDTPILVRNHQYKEWERRYFSKYEDGKVYVFDNGRTSWNAVTDVCWQYAKLYEEGVDD